MSEANFIPAERVERRILLIRGQKVMWDSDLAELYGVQTKALNQAVKRNNDRFPKDFMFRLTKTEAELVMRSRIVTLHNENGDKSLVHKGLSRSQTVTLKQGHNVKYLPYVFTEQGVAMLSSVLRSSRAIQVNIAIMRTFVRLRQLLATHADLSRKLKGLEKKYDSQFKVVFDAIRELMDKDKTPKAEIGFHTLIREPSRRPGARKPKARRP